MASYAYGDYDDSDYIDDDDDDDDRYDAAPCPPSCSMCGSEAAQMRTHDSALFFCDEFCQLEHIEHVTPPRIGASFKKPKASKAAAAAGSGADASLLVAAAAFGSSVASLVEPCSARVERCNISVLAVRKLVADQLRAPGASALDRQMVRRLVANMATLVRQVTAPDYEGGETQRQNAAFMAEQRRLVTKAGAKRPPPGDTSNPVSVASALLALARAPASQPNPLLALRTAARLAVLTAVDRTRTGAAWRSEVARFVNVLAKEFPVEAPDADLIRGVAALRIAASGGGASSSARLAASR